MPEFYRELLEDQIIFFLFVPTEKHFNRRISANKNMIIKMAHFFPLNLS